MLLNHAAGEADSRRDMKLYFLFLKKGSKKAGLWRSFFEKMLQTLDLADIRLNFLCIAYLQKRTKKALTSPIREDQGSTECLVNIT